MYDLFSFFQYWEEDIDESNWEGGGFEVDVVSCLILFYIDVMFGMGYEFCYFVVNMMQQVVLFFCGWLY